MWELWFNDRLQEHLAERKTVLDSLRERVDNLVMSISQKTNELAALERDIDVTSAQNIAADRALQGTREEIQARTTELREMKQNISVLHEQLAQSERNLQSGNRVQDSNAKVQEHQHEIARLENEVALLGRSIDRILLVRAKHGLQTK
jgi:chromosome segregation ATPase